MANTKPNGRGANPSGAQTGRPQQIETIHDGICMVVGNVAVNTPPAVKTTGVKMRGTGAATKGTMSRGPMA